MSVSQAAPWEDAARQLRIDIVRATASSGSGHPTSGASSADLLAVLGASHFHLDVDDPRHPGNDRFVLSKGHAASALYAWLKLLGAIDDEELLTYASPGSRLEGHPRPVLPWVDVATGSLGQGIAAGVGLALSLSRLEHSPAHVFVQCGHSEMAEGSVWESFDHASHYRLANLVALIDVNGLGQRGPTILGHDTAAYARRAEAFGWQALEVDGHDHAQVDAALRLATASPDRPTVIVARTEKGHGLGSVAGLDGWHGRPLADAEDALEGLGSHPRLVLTPRPPYEVAPRQPQRREPALPAYPVGGKVATRLAYGEALVAVGDALDDVVVLDAETGNSTHAELFAQAHPDRFFEMFIAEQQMLGAAVGLAARGWTPFASTFAAFTTRAFDFARMAAIGGTAVRLCGSHSGLSVGESGASGMALEDIACFRSIAGSVVLQPCDGNQAAALVATAADVDQFVYLRTSRNPVPVIYEPGESFPVGGSRVLAESADDAATVVASGIVVHAALEAAELLRDEGVSLRVIDAYSVKPIDAATVLTAAENTRLVVAVEDHYAEGGLGSAVAEVLAESGSATRLVRHAVRGIPTSGKVAALYGAAGLDGKGVAAVVRTALGDRAPEPAGSSRKAG